MTTPPTIYSPINKRRLYESYLDGARWTVDNTEHRHQRLIDSPRRRSILKGSHTPLRYNSPLFQHEQVKRRERLEEKKKVSFAPDAHLRVFSREDSPDINDMRNVPSIIEETEPPMMASDMFSSPFLSHTGLRSPGTRITGSPLDQRRRQPDLFGSPPSSTRSLHQRSGGQPPSLLNRVFHEDDEDDEEEEDNTTTNIQHQNQPDLTHFLSVQHQKSPRNLFDEEEDDEEEEDRRKKQKREQDLMLADEDITMESMIMTQVIEPAKSKKRPDEEATMDVVEEYDVPLAPEADDDAMQITQELSPYYSRMDTFSPLRPSSSLHPPASPSPIRSVAYSPLRPQSTLLVASPSKALSTQSRASSFYSPAKSFYLHDRSPMSSRSQRSMSLGSDHVFQYENNSNLLEEEFSGLYDSTIEGDVNANITLTDFLRYVGIEFPNPTTLEPFKYPVDDDDTDHTQSATVTQQVMAATSVLPQLEFYERTVDKVNDLIEHTKEKIELIEQDINQANPQFFFEFREGSVAVRTQMESRLDKLKSYAHLKASIQWLEWFANTLIPLLDTLQEYNRSLEKDQQQIQQFEELIHTKVTDIGVYHAELSRVLTELQEREIKYNTLDSKRLQKLQEEIEQQRNTMQSYQRQMNSLESEEFEMIEKIALLNKQKQDRLDAIQEANRTLEKHPYVTEKEFVEAADTFNRCVEIHQFRLEKNTDQIIQFGMSGGINITFDIVQLQNRGERAVLIQLSGAREIELGPLAELVHGLKIVVRDKWDMNEITQDIAMYWNRVSMIQYELKELQKRFWVKIEALEFAEVPEEAGFSFDVCLTSFVGKAKFTISLDIKPKNVLDYPLLDLDSMKVNLHYGLITQEDLEDLLKKALSGSGFTNLVDTLRDILDQISIPNHRASQF